jgi:hypothetical protein
LDTIGNTPLVALDRLSRGLFITPKADVTKPAVVPAPEPATSAPTSKPRKSCLQKFWQSMNEPVIEIDLRKDQDKKNK